MNSLLLLLVLHPEVWSYEAPEEKKDVFARRACPAFLTFTNAAYLAGATVELPCRCKPQQVGSVVWFYKEHLGSSEDTKALTDHHGNKLLDSSRVPHGGDLRSRFSIRLFSLLIFRVGADDSGLYICGSAQKDFFSGYDLDVQEGRVLSFNASESFGLGSVRPPYQIFTSFRPWSVCDRCGPPGEKIRVGLCYIRSDFLHVRFRRANQKVASCGSGAVPAAFGLSNQRRRHELFLESMSNDKDCFHPYLFPGCSSASKPAPVPVFYLNHPADHVLTLGCPGAKPNMAVAWDRGSEPIYRFDYSADSNGSTTPTRRLIDAGHHLVFKPARSHDSGVYHCWLQGRRAAEIRLLVYVRLGRGQSVTSHPEFRLAVDTLLTWYAAMTVAFCLLLLGRAAVRHVRDAAQTQYD
uniref:Ig-like domain-containing protein n=1 Tax=Echeneis naucrates TaxID=173247 RepID=A0A665VNU1_ECHNA